MGPVIVFALGVGCGVFLHNLWRRFWAASGVAALAATGLWGGGCYLLLALTAPHELGPPLLIPVLLTVGTAFVGAAAGGGILRAIRAG